MTIPTDRLLKLSEVCRLLHVHRNTLSSWIGRRKIAVVTLPGGDKRIDPQDLLAFIADRKSAAGSVAHDAPQDRSAHVN